MADVKWIKLSTDIFSNRKIVQIESMPEGDALIVIWLKLLILAGETNADGMVWFTSTIPYTEQMLATAFGRPMSTIQLALKTFSAFGMIEIVDDYIRIPNWEKYQNVEGLEKVREQTRKRVAEYRERKKALPERSALNNVTERNVTGNATVTQSNATDIDKELDKEEDYIKEKVKKENALRSAPRDGVLNVFEKFAGDDDELAIALRGFAEMRKSIKKPLTENAASLICKKLMKFPARDWVEIINQSTMNSWQGIFPLDGKTAPQKSNKRESTLDWLKRKTEEGAFDE